MKNILRNKNFYIMLFLDSLLILAAYFLAYLLRFEGKIAGPEWKNFYSTIPYILVLKLFAFWFLGLYRGMYRYVSVVDFLNVVKATLISSVAVVLTILFIHRFEGFSRSVFIIDWALSLLFIGGVRIGVRLFLFEKRRGFFSLRQMFKSNSEGVVTRPVKRLVIIGAGDAGEKILREIRDNPRLNYEVFAFLDDDPRKQSMKIHGVPVRGPIDKIQQLASQAEIDEILIAIPSASTTQMKRIVEICETTGIKVNTTPGIGELINGKITFKTIREVSFEDLLGRDPVNLDMRTIGDYLTDKVLLVSGAGGSIGSELCRQVTRFRPRNLILVDNTENNLFHLEMEFRQKYPDHCITPVLGDVQDPEFLEKIFADRKPQVVFHSAAYKHVPIVELNPWQGVFNNIIGTRNMVEASHRHHAERFIMISTDKAVRPTNVMGATKRIAEMITSSYGLGNASRFASVRFGNVIGSEGSVVHLFKRQIERFGPVTVTHPEMTRYFMTIPEACKLILQAGALGRGGEIFILDMGTPIKIVKMARDLIRLSGFNPDGEIEIQFVGLRPGEKLYEELITEGEGIVRTDYEKIFVLKGNGYDIHWVNQRIEELVNLAHAQDASGIKAKLKEIVPEYQPFDLTNIAPPQSH